MSCMCGVIHANEANVRETLRRAERGDNAHAADPPRGPRVPLGGRRLPRLPRQSERLQAGLVATRAAASAKAPGVAWLLCRGNSRGQSW